MRTYNYYQKNNVEIVVILGFFDCMHAGHIALVEQGKSIAESIKAEPAVFTYTNDINAVFGVSEGQVLTYGERLTKIEKLGINSVIYCDFDKNYASHSGEEFLDVLFENYKIKAIVCGYDYTYGKDAGCGVRDLQEYCGRRNVPCIAESEVKIDGVRVSTTLIKKYLSDGNIEYANKLLVYPYFILGKVIEGRKDGRKIGFPTANVLLPNDKFRIKRGVYKPRVVVDGKSYAAITNFGTQPTFGSDKLVIESHLKDFDSDIYGFEILIIFEDYIRDIYMFSDIDDLKKQLKKDMETLR